MRRLLVTAPALAFLVAVMSAARAAPDPQPSGVMTPRAAPDPQPVGKLTGSSSQGLRVTIGPVRYLPAVRYHGRTFRFYARLTCTSAPSGTGGPFLVDVHPGRDGRFRTNAGFEVNDFPAAAEVRGRIQGSHASGTLSMKETLYASSAPPGGIPCSTGRVSWRAAGS
jgi:hypothetical protein